MKFFDLEHFKSAPVRVTVYFDAELFEKATTAAKLHNMNFERFLVELVKCAVSELESQGLDLTPNWLKKIQELQEGRA